MGAVDSLAGPLAGRPVGVTLEVIVRERPEGEMTLLFKLISNTPFHKDSFFMNTGLLVLIVFLTIFYH